MQARGSKLYDAPLSGASANGNGLAGVPSLEALLSCSDSCFKILDLDGRIVYLSPSASRVLRLDAARLVGCAHRVGLARIVLFRFL